MRWLKYSLVAVLALLLLQVGMFAGIGLYRGLDVVSGIRQYVRLLTSSDLVPDAVQPVEAGRLSSRSGEVAWTGDLENEHLEEASGLAVSANGTVLYSVNDSGNEPRLFAFRTNGADLGSWAIDHEGWHDFEDLSSFTLEGRRYLLIADTGDNFYWRPHLKLLVIAEPEIDTLADDAVLQVEWQVQFSFEDGYRDVEAVAVDSEEGRVYLLSKRHVPPELFSVPLRRGKQDVTAVLHTRVTGIPLPTARDLREDPDYGRYRSVPTAMDINGRRALVVTYKDAYLFTRRRGESWEQAMGGLPLRVPLPDIHQLESGVLDSNRIYLTGERRNGYSRMGVFRVDL